MNRSETQSTLNTFFDRAACTTIADAALAAAYIKALRGYLSKLEEDFEPIDSWSVEEYERVCEFIYNNFKWTANPEVAAQALADAYALLGSHKSFLDEHGLLPDYLTQRPNPSFQWTPAGAAEFAR